MRKMILIVWGTLLLLLTACSSGGGADEPTPDISGIEGDTSGDDMESFDISPDYTAYAEAAEVIPTDETDENYGDFIENSVFDAVVNIRFADGTATVGNTIEGVTVTHEGAHVKVVSTVKQVEYVLSGKTSDGSLKVYSDYKFKLTLNGVELTNPQGAAINIQSGKRAFVVCLDNTTNTLRDGTTYMVTDGGEDMKACLFSEGQLIFSGGGILNVTGNGKHAICSDDYLRFRAGCRINVTANARHGLKANDAVIIGGGALNITAAAAASKGISCNGFVRVDGGRTMVVTSGGGMYENNDVSACAGIKCDSIFIMNKGILALKSTGEGGKGLNADQEITVNGGTLKILTSGGEYVYDRLDASPKGIKSDAAVTLNGGHILVRATGGKGSEGIDSKTTLAIGNATVEVSAYGDCLKASERIAVSGGKVYCYSSANDGIDSKGDLHISGGYMVVAATKKCFNYNPGTFAVQGGTVVGVASSTRLPDAAACRQPAVIYGGSNTAGTYWSLADGAGKHLLAYKVPRNYPQMALFISSPALKQGNNYTLFSGGQVSGGKVFHGLITGGSYSSGSPVTGFSVGSMVTQVNF